jgi:O-antigen ligase
MTNDWLYRIFHSPHRWLGIVAALAMCAGLALVAGYLLAELGPVIGTAGLVAIFLGLWMMRDIEVAYWVVIGVVCLLPFASFPFEIGFTPTLLDAALGALFFVWAFQVATAVQRDFIGTSLGLPIGVFILLAVGSFLFGLSHATLTSYLIRHFGEILLSVALFFLVVNTVRGTRQLKRLVRALVLGAFAAAALGIILYVIAALISDDWVVSALSKLGRLGYPVGAGVLRYIREDPSLPMRATSTSVDPNVLGSLLNLALCVAVPQFFARRPVIRRRLLLLVVGTIALCLGLTISRSALVGVGITLAVVATLKYKYLWPFLLIAVGVVLVVAPGYVGHFVEGIQLQDLATQMRLGEYKDALILIGRYPWFGVGFAGSPDIDTYVGVSMVYLLIAEQMGLIGLASFVVIMIVFFVRFWRTRRMATDEPDLEPLWWGLHAGIFGALVGGFFDHYFFNLDFHHSVTLFWLVVGLATAATEIIRKRHAGDLEAEDPEKGETQ